MTGGRTLAALLSLAALAGGCQTAVDQAPAAPPFVFRTLDLRQKDPQGRPAWELQSPEARYDLGRQLTQARDLRGLIYRGGQPLYRLTASSGVILQDGEVVQLEGPTRLERLGSNPAVITALRMRWYPRQGRMLIDRQPLAVQKSLELRADQASFDFNRDTLVLEGQPQLLDRGEPTLHLDLKRLQWWAEAGDLVGEGPVRGSRLDARGRRQTLTSPGLLGNSLRQQVVLQAPVLVLDPAEDAELRAGVTMLELGSERITSTAPFQARRGQATLQGLGFTALKASTTLVIPAGCRLNQPGDELSADQCRWNWTSNAVQARGRVILRRQASGQITQAEHLDGRAAEDGQLVFSQPGGRVVSQLKVPETAAADRRRPRSRPLDPL